MLSYKDVFELDIKLWNWLEENNSNEKRWENFYAFYEDPDGYPGADGKFKYVEDIKCTADGLLSIKRIKHFEGISNEFINTFRCYRKTPIIFFPCEKNGINELRARLLEDRIDHTLLDLKNYCEGKTDCILEAAYKLPETQKWLKYFEYDFGKIANWLGIIDIFVERNSFEVYDLEKNDGSKLIKLKEKPDYIGVRNSEYLSAWSSEYYCNIKKKIEEYERTNK